MLLASTLSAADDTIFDFCPQEGQVVEYNITLAVDQPAYQQFTQYWHTPDETVTTIVRREISGPKSPDPFILKLRIGEQISEPGNYQGMTGWPIEILQDDIGIYQDVKELFWAYRDEESPRYIAEICVFDAQEQGPPDTVVQSDGKSIRPIFLLGRPNSSLWLGDEKNDTLFYIGLMNKTRHFERRVDAINEEEPAFSEKTVFEVGSGLTELEQWLDGDMTMRWERVFD